MWQDLLLEEDAPPATDVGLFAFLPSGEEAQLDFSGGTARIAVVPHNDTTALASTGAHIHLLRHTRIPASHIATGPPTPTSVANILSSAFSTQQMTTIFTTALQHASTSVHDQAVSAFASIVPQLSLWTVNPMELSAALAAALSAGALRFAREIAITGAAAYPERSNFRALPEVEPAPTPRTSPSRRHSPAANIAWLSVYAQDFKGKWIALRDGNLLGVSDSIEDVRSLARDGEGILITRIPS